MGNIDNNFNMVYEIVKFIVTNAEIKLLIDEIKYNKEETNRRTQIYKKATHMYDVILNYQDSVKIKICIPAIPKFDENIIVIYNGDATDLKYIGSKEQIQELILNNIAAIDRDKTTFKDILKFLKHNYNI